MDHRQWSVSRILWCFETPGAEFVVDGNVFNLYMVGLGDREGEGFKGSLITCCINLFVYFCTKTLCNFDVPWRTLRER